MADIYETIAAEQAAEEHRRELAKRDLIAQVASGTLDDPQAIATQLGVVGISTDELKAGVARLHRRAELAPLIAKKAKVKKDIEKNHAAAAKAREDRDEAIKACRQKIEQLADKLAWLEREEVLVQRAEDELRNLLDPIELEPLSQIDTRIVTLNQERHQLQGLLKDGLEYIDADGQKQATHAKRRAVLVQELHQCDDRYSKSRDEGERAKLDVRKGELKQAIKGIDATITSDTKRLAQIDRELSKLQAERAKTEKKILEG